MNSALAPISNQIFIEDCFSGMNRIPDQSVDLILCDLPYGTTQCRWDSILPFDELWKAWLRVIKPHAAIVLTASQPFTSAVVMSNPKLFRYSWVWEKSKATGYLNAKKRPLVAHEDVLVFSQKAPRYFPQMTQGTPYNKGEAHRPTDVYGSQKSVLVKNDHGLRYPRSVQYFKTAESEGPVIHPTQKPLSLFRYLIETYSKPGELVLDNCMGSGTTAVACAQTGRTFVGFENDKEYVDPLEKRVREVLPGFEVVRQ